MGSLFEFADVHVVVDGAEILAGVTTTIPDHQLTVVAGASGSGKTSLLRLCNRLDVPTSGTASFAGQDLLSIDPQQLRRRVGMVFQRPVLFGGTVRDNLLTADPEANGPKVLSALANAELGPGFLDRIGDDLSGGEAQRVCLARTLMCDPTVLLMDEPTASLHEAAAKALETTVKKLSSEGGVSVVWVTHNLDQIERLAEYLIVLEDGKVRYSGVTETAAARDALASLSSGDET
ncbi:MAG: ATP-binding cassette domain-containing protein [Acidimicrobiia bacterium]|nr:ATP-binding cassette domain-containing protein [Acidimicrobiia bacterium]MDX2467960.1 ATP-binding cassette domain-containing protein [Acidimicrobiia bacterium]